MSSLPLGSISDTTGYSPADFGDAEDMRPLQVQLDPTGMGSPTPYSTLVNNVLQRHAIEIREKTLNPSPTPSNWRRKLREFMMTKNEDLVSFLKKPVGSQSALSRADVFVQKFGRGDFQANHPSLQYVFLDASGGSIVPQIEAELLSIGPSSPKEIIDQVRWLYDAYKAAGEECLKQDNFLKLKLDILDKTYQKVVGFCDLPINEDSEKVTEAIDAYVQKLYVEHDIQDQYKRTIEAYRRFAALKEMIQLMRFTDLQDKEPLCSICLDESVAFALVPCGHTFCGNCVKKQTHSCYMCRTVIRDRAKLYFG